MKTICFANPLQCTLCSTGVGLPRARLQLANSMGDENRAHLVNDLTSFCAGDKAANL